MKILKLSKLCFYNRVIISIICFRKGIISYRSIAITSLLLVVFATVSFSANAVDSLLLHQTKQLLNAQQLTPAITLIKLHNKEHPKDPQGYELLGKIYTRIGLLDDAERLFKQSLGLDPGNSGLRLLLADNYYNAGRYRICIELLKQADFFDLQLKAEAKALVGMSWVKLNKSALARNSFLESLRFGDVPKVHLGKASLAFSEKDFEQAHIFVDEAIEKSGGKLGVALKGDIYIEEKKYSKALSVYIRSAKGGNKLKAKLNTAKAYYYLGDYVSSVSLLEELLKATPKTLSVHYWYAVNELAEGKFEDAKNRAEMLLGKGVYHHRVYLIAGIANYMQANLNTAEVQISIFLSENKGKSYPNVERVLADIHLRQSKVDKAAIVLTRVVQQEVRKRTLIKMIKQRKNKEIAELRGDLLFSTTLPDEAFIRLRKHLTISRFLLGQTKDAIAGIHAALRDPQLSNERRGEYITLLVLSYIQNSAMDLAEEELTNVLRKDPSAYLYFLYGTLLKAQNKNHLAYQAFESSTKIEPEFIPALLSMGQQDLMWGQLENAKTKMQSILRLEPHHFGALLVSSQVAVQEENQSKFERYMVEIISHHSRTLDGIGLVINYQLKRGEYDEAFLLLKAIHSGNNSHPGVTSLFAKTLIASGRPKEAIPYVTTLLQHNIQSREHKLMLVDLLLKLDKKTEAIYTLNTLLRETSLDNERLVSLLLKKVEVLFNMGDMEGIKSLAEQANIEIGDMSAHHLILGLYYSKLKEYDNSIYHYSKAYGKRDSKQLIKNLFELNIKAGDEDIAVEFLENHLLLKPGDIYSRTMMANYYLRNEELDNARFHFIKILEKIPDHLVALNNLAWIGIKQQDKSVKDYALKAVTLAPNDYRTNDTYAWYLVQFGRIGEGIKYFNKALINGGRKDPSLLFRYTLALFGSGNKKDALVELKLLLQSHQDFPELIEAEKLLELEFEISSEKV